jgi:hypothetical protein
MYYHAANLREDEGVLRASKCQAERQCSLADVDQVLSVTNDVVRCSSIDKELGFIVRGVVDGEGGYMRVLIVGDDGECQVVLI